MEPRTEIATRLLESILRNTKTENISIEPLSKIAVRMTDSLVGELQRSNRPLGSYVAVTNDPNEPIQIEPICEMADIMKEMNEPDQEPVEKQSLLEFQCEEGYLEARVDEGFYTILNGVGNNLKVIAHIDGKRIDLGEYVQPFASIYTALEQANTHYNYYKTEKHEEFYE